MKGRYHFRVKSKKTVFEFDIKRNITVLKGDSATGKTTLLHMMYEYLRAGRESGYSVSADCAYYVYLRREIGRSWQDILFPLENTVIFIEENNHFVFSKEFAQFVRMSGNYFVLVSRSPLKMLPYSIHEIYEIILSTKHGSVRESYHELKELYSNYPVTENNRADIVITEDSNSGYQFFSKLFENRQVVSARGSSRILDRLKELQQGGLDLLAVADGAAFGAEIETCLEYSMSRTGQRIAVWMPESFEYLILQSGLIPSAELQKILASVSDYVEAKDFESWEQFFTQLLIRLTYKKSYRYSKKLLDDYYLQEKNIHKIVAVFPDAVKCYLKTGMGDEGSCQDT